MPLPVCWVDSVVALTGLRQTELVPADDLWAPLAGRFVDGHYGTLRGRGSWPGQVFRL